MTAMLNDTFALMLNPRFLDPDTMEAEAKPLERYVSKDGRKAFIHGLIITGEFYCGCNVFVAAVGPEQFLHLVVYGWFYFGIVEVNKIGVPLRMFLPGK